uniref:Uncharacterized protein n=1 Tax=Arundo donax TaxID=35708 RepID=A0A0A8Y2X7_ARUDO
MLFSEFVCFCSTRSGFCSSATRSWCFKCLINSCVVATSSKSRRKC